MTRRAFVRGATAATAGAVALLVAGCSGEEEPAEEAPADPLAQLRAAAVQTLSTSSHVELASPRVEASGDVDPLGQSLRLDIRARGDDGTLVRQTVRVVGSDAYVILGRRYVPDVDPGKYLQFTAGTPAFAAVTAVHLAEPYDPAGLKTVGFAFVDARRTGEGRIAGTLDLTKALPGTSRGLLPAAKPEQLRAAGDAVRRIPYEATTGDGFLTSITVRMPAYGTAAAYDSISRFSAFEDPVTVERPQAAEIAEMTEDLRQILID